MKNERFLSNNSTKSPLLLFFNFIRSPLETILSGFDYHAGCKAELGWTVNMPIRKAGHPGLLPKKGLSYMRTPSVALCHVFNSEIDDFAREGIDKIPENLRLFNNSQNLEKSICEYYRELENAQKAYGLFYEFLRFVNCQFTAAKMAHLQVVQLTKEKEIAEKRGELFDIAGYDMRMENFKSNFSKMANFIADLWNVKDTDENRQILLRNGHSNIDLKAERKKLVDLLEFQANIMETKSPLNEKRERLHITSNKHNRTEEAIALLGFSQGVCKKIKNMTLALDYTWKEEFSVFC